MFEQFSCSFFRRLHSFTRCNDLAGDSQLRLSHQEVNVSDTQVIAEANHLSVNGLLCDQHLLSGNSLVCFVVSARLLICT